MSNGKSRGDSVRKREMPFGWEQGDPCVVCTSYYHMEYVQLAFKLRAHYILPLSAITGRRYNKIIIFKPFMIQGSSEEIRFMSWVRQYLYTSLPPPNTPGYEGLIWV